MSKLSKALRRITTDLADKQAAEVFAAADALETLERQLREAKCSLRLLAEGKINPPGTITAQQLADLTLAKLRVLSRRRAGGKPKNGRAK